MIKAFRLLTIIAATSMFSPSYAEVLTSKKAVQAYFSKAVFLEKSNKLGTDIHSIFDKRRWIQQTLEGKKLGSSRLILKKDGRVCPEWWGGKCAYIDVAKGGFYFANAAGKRGDKFFRRVQ